MTYTPHAKPYVLDLNPVETIESLKHLPAILKEGDFMLAQLYKDLKLVAQDIAAINTAVSASAAKVTQSQAFLPFLADDPSGDEPISLLPGLQGARGLQGFQGAPGLDGDQGEDGLPGIQGLTGAAGAAGAPGATGATGAQGNPGPGLVTIENDLEEWCGILGPPGPTFYIPFTELVFAYNSTTQTINNNTQTALTFDTNDTISSGTLHSTSANTSRFVASTAGLWFFHFGGAYASGNVAGAQRSFYAQTNGTTFIRGTRFDAAANLSQQGGQVTGCLTMAAGDYIEMLTFQDSGSNITVGGTAPDACAMLFTRVR